MASVCAVCVRSSDWRTSANSKHWTNAGSTMAHILCWSFVTDTYIILYPVLESVFDLFQTLLTQRKVKLTYNVVWALGTILWNAVTSLVENKVINTPPPYFIVLASSVKTKEVKVIEFHRIQSEATLNGNRSLNVFPDLTTNHWE